MPGDRASAISRNGCYGIWIGTAASVRLDAGELHHFGPLLGFAGEETAEVGGWAGQHRSTHVGQPRLRLGVGEDCIDLHVEPPDDLRRRVPGRNDAEERAGLV